MGREKRKKLEIYNDILHAIQQESTAGKVKPTRVSHICNMSYDKMTNYLEELRKKKLIQTSQLLITEKGQKFLQDYSKIKEFVDKMEIEYVKEKEIPNDL